MIITHNGNILMNGGVVLNKIATSPSPSPSFLNQYSMDFDGVNDRVTLNSSVNLGINSTVSLWLKPDSGWNGDLLGELSYLYNYLMYSKENSNFYVRIGTFAVDYGSVGLTSGVWNHILLQRTGDSISLYFNGVLKGTNVGFGTSLDTKFDTIGADSGNDLYTIEGKIDEVAGWNNNTINPSDIYNDGIPTDLTSFSPVAWYRMGDSATWKSPQWLLPSNENKDKVSNYSFDFDGTDDYIDCGNDTSLDLTELSISMWVKFSSYSGNKVLFGKKPQTSYYINCSAGAVYFWTGGSFMTSGNIGVDDNNWHHLLFTVDSSSKNIYMDGILKTTGASVLPTIDTISLHIGNAGAVTNPFQGKIDEVCLLDYALTQQNATDIYNNGTPNDLTSLNPVSWWRMGDSSTFSTNWTVPDEVGTNDGTSANMTIEDRIGDAPNSTNNALSLNMDEVDVVADVPPSFNTKSITFDGADDYVSAPQTFLNGTLGVHDSFTISFWAKKPTATDSVQVGDLGQNGNGSAFYGIWVLWYIDGRVIFSVRNNNNNSIETTLAFDTNWHHFFCTKSVNTLKIYIDGTLIQTGVGPTNLPSATGNMFRIGSIGSTYFGKSTIDEVALWDTDQGANVTDIYNGGVPNDLSSLNPMSWYRMGDGDTYPTITDHGSEGSNGTMTNMDASDIENSVPS